MGGPGGGDNAPDRRFRALVIALAVDNLGSGMFVPLTVVVLVRSVGLTVGTAGVALTVGAVVGVIAPAVVVRVSDRVTALGVVVTSMLVQAAGLGCYLVAHGVALTVVAAALVAGGTQTFYSALFTLIAELDPAAAKDRAYATVAMVRTTAFGIGGVAAAVLLSVASTNALRFAVAADAASFVAAVAVLVLLVRSGGAERPVDLPHLESSAPAAPRRAFVAFMGTVSLLALATDVFLIGLPVYALTILRTVGWVPGACLAMLTAATGTLTGLTVRRTVHLARTTMLGVGACCFVVWAVVVAAAAALPAGWAAPWLLGSTVLLIAGVLASETRASVIAEAAVPPLARGRYLALFQYAFTVAQIVAPLVVALFAFATWLPWLVVAVAAAAGVGTLPWLTRNLPARAVGPA